MRPVAVVTGASRGIGRAAALRLSADGFAIAAVARTKEGLEETCRLVELAEGSAVSNVADVSDRAAALAAVESIEAETGPIAVLVNNAGSLRAIGPVWEVDPGDWWADIQSSLGGAFVWCQAVVPRLVARGAGRIVNVTSYAACRPAPYETAYACAKAALISLTEALAASLRSSGVTAFGIAPGFTPTELTRHLQDSDAGRRWLPDVGTGRATQVDESAALISLLAGGSADALNGRVLHTLDRVEELLGRLEEIRRDDLYVPRLRRLP